MKNSRNGWIFVVGLMAACLLGAPPAVVAEGPLGHAVLIREAYMYISPDSSSAKIATLQKGRDLALVARSHDWVQVFATVEGSNPETGEGRDVTGWMENKGVVAASMPDADKVIFGEAENCEAQASHPNPPAGAAQEAGRLYYWLYENLPQSPLAPEALYRAADVKWQLEKADIMSLPSYKTEAPNIRSHMHEDLMKEVEKKYPRTKWAELAAYELLDNKVCGDWQGRSKCPEKETELYMKYAQEHPDSPKAPEALYQAAYRQAALIEIYPQAGDAGKAEGAKAHALQIVQQIQSKYPQSDWSARAATLAYKLNNGLAVYAGQVQ